MKRIVLLLMLFSGAISCTSAQQKSNKSDTLKPKKINVPVRHQRLPPHKMMRMVDTTRRDSQKVRP